MIELVNKMTGSRMWVAEERKDEYLAAGHKPAASPAAKPAEKELEAEPEEKPAKKRK